MMQRGALVSIRNSAHRVTAPASQNRSTVSEGVVVRKYPGGQYDHGDLYLVTVNEQARVVSESMMQHRHTGFECGAL